MSSVTLELHMGEQISDTRFAAFYGLLVVEWRISERLDAELAGAAGVSLNRLELLLHLHFKDGRRRMSDLADALLLSRGGATRLVARAEEDGLVRREIPPDDRRATYAVLTDAGREAAERGLPVYTRDRQTGSSTTSSTTRRRRSSSASGTACSTGNDMACAPVTHAAEALERSRFRVSVAIRR